MLRLGGKKTRTEAGREAQDEPSKDELVSGRGKRSSRFFRVLGLLIATLGVLAIAWATYIFFFGDPITALYQDWRQHQMAGQLDREFKRFKPPIPLNNSHDGLSRVSVRKAALSFSHQARSGQPIGRIEIPRIEIGEIFVNGTDWGADLSRGPGRYPQSSWPGLGKVTAIAGHRTTFGAPFRHIDVLETGDRVLLEMPYATLTYRIFAHKIVRNNDWSILRERRFDTLVLSACHPLYSASHRWIVFARLASVAAPAPLD